MKSLAILANVIIAATASAAVLGPWPAGTVYTWETQPISGYASGLVSITAPDVLLMPTPTGAPKRVWLPYAVVDPAYAERLALAQLIVPPGKLMATLHVKIYDPNQVGKSGWAVILYDNTGKILDFGVRPYFAPGKIMPHQYDGTAWTDNPGSPTGTWYERLRTGNDYYTLDLTRNADGTLSWSLLGWIDGVPWAAPHTGTTTVAYGDIAQVYLSTATKDTSGAANYKWTEFGFVSSVPDPCPAPTVATILPNAGTSGQTLTGVAVTGSGFVAGETGIAFKMSGQAAFGATNVIVTDAGNLTCDVAVPATAGAGDWDVVATTWCGQGTLAGAFTVACNDPTASAIVPGEGTRLQTTNVIITGSNFVSGQTTVRLRMAGQPDILATNVNVINAGSLTCDITPPAGAEVGFWDVVVSTCSSATIYSGFQVLCNTPIVSSISPAEGMQDQTVSVTIGGSGFDPRPGRTFVMLQKADQLDIFAIGAKVNGAGTSITCDFYVPIYAGGGAWDVVVTTCATGSLAGGFTVLCAQPGPSVASIAPAEGNPGQTLTGVVITGAGFMTDWTTVFLTKAGQDPIEATNVIVTDPGSLVCDLALPSGVATGLWTVEVVTTCSMGTRPDAFEVKLPCNTPPQDADGDHDVDLDDFATFSVCFNGPNRPWPGPPVPADDCACLDIDKDLDVDLGDFGAFSACFNGPNRAPACG